MEISASYSSPEAEPLSLKAEHLWFGNTAALPREITFWLLHVFTSFWGPWPRWTQTSATPQFLLITTKRTKSFLKECPSHNRDEKNEFTTKHSQSYSVKSSDQSRSFNSQNEAFLLTGIQPGCRNTALISLLLHQLHPEQRESVSIQVSLALAGINLPATTDTHLPAPASLQKAQLELGII